MQHDFSLFFETDNEYWQKVLDIFAKNEKYEKKVVSNRNLHHKFPRSFSKKLGEPIDNDKDNLISLSLADHFLVHYYYYLLAKKGYRQAMATAFTFMAKKSLKFLTPETAGQVAKDYEEAKLIADQLNKGKTYREIYGEAKAKELIETRRKFGKSRGSSAFGGYKPSETALIKCVETGEIHTYSEWLKILKVKSKSSLCNILNNPNKCCRKKHFVKMDEVNGVE